MRLIDADADREEFMERVYDILSDEPDNIKANLIIDAFDEMKVAYDLENVMSEIGKLYSYSNPYDSYWDYEAYRMTEFKNKIINSIVSKAIEIVKAGGVNE